MEISVNIDENNIEYNVELNINTLDQYESILSRYKEWISFKRDIKLTNILESGKRIQFDIKDLSIFGSMNNDSEKPLQSPAFIITSMMFILNGNNVDNLSIVTKDLTTYCGKIYRSKIDNGLKMGIKQHIIDNNVIYFYIINQDDQRSIYWLD